MARMLWVALLAAIVACAAADHDFAGVIYGIEVGEDKRIFQINTTNPGVIRDDTIALVYDLTANRGTPEVDDECFGRNFNTNPPTENPSSPNALANDGVNRLYFTATDRPARQTPARLCFYSFITVGLGSTKVKYVEQLQGYTVINGATFDQNGYSYVFVKDALEQQPESDYLNIVFARLSRTTGEFRQVDIVTNFRNTTAPGNPTFVNQMPLIYKGGDQAFNCERVFYASSIRVDNSDKYFFSVDFSSQPGGFYNYVLIHNDNYLPDGSLVDPTNETATGFATNDQIAFDGDGDLVSQSSKDGIFSFVDLATGANNELAPINTTNVQFLNPDGTVRRFADLASYLDCEVEVGCIDTFQTNPCVEGQIVVPSPTDTGGRPCGPVEITCLNPVTCEPTEVCLVYQYI